MGDWAEGEGIALGGAPLAPLGGPATDAGEEPPEGDRSRSPDSGWAAWTAPVALLAGLALALIGGLLVDVPALLLGVKVTTSHTPPGITIADTFVQDLGFVAAALFCAHFGGRAVRGWQLGLRRPGIGWPAAVGMIVVLLLAFLALTAAWSEAVNPGREKLLEQLGSNEGTLLLVLSAGLTCVVAPICEETLFRGYIFTALRSWRGTLPAALLTGILFGGVHVGSAPGLDLLPLAALGFGLCLLYRNTGSLYPCIIAHCLNNCAAFASLEGWGWGTAGLLVLASILVISGGIRSPRPPRPQRLGHSRPPVRSIGSAAVRANRKLSAGVLLVCAALAPAGVAAAAEAPPAAGSMKLSLHGVGGSPPFVLVGGRMTVGGTVSPYVPGQTVKLSVYRQRVRVAVEVLPVLPSSEETGRFQLTFHSSDAGAVEVRATHYLTPQQAAFEAASPIVHFVNANIGPGSSGQSVRLLQAELAALHYAVPLNGRFDEGTGNALIAYRKLTGLERIPAAGRAVFQRLRRHAGAFHVRYARDGRHVEADLTRQVLAEIDPGGRVHLIYTMSSGKPSTPTVIGRFRVYMKTPGFNSEGMFDSNYFIRGYAIHGYAEVPTYAASHGCLRVPIPDAPAIYGWVREGTPVDVYEQDGGGSARVSADAGP